MLYARRPTPALKETFMLDGSHREFSGCATCFHHPPNISDILPFRLSNAFCPRSLGP